MNRLDTPERQRVLKTKVVVATLATAASLHNLGVPRGHLDLIVVDEAGQAQAQEPEAIAAAACLLGPDSQLIVAGDPQQLGPVIHAPLSKEYGLGVSLLERLLVQLHQRVLHGRAGLEHCTGALQRRPKLERILAGRFPSQRVSSRELDLHHKVHT